MTDRLLYLLDRFHQGLLTQEEQVEFDHAMKIPEFAEAIKLGPDIKVAIESMRINAFRKRMTKWEEQLPVQKTNSKLFWSIGIALIIGLLFVIFMLTKSSDEPSNYQIFAEYAKPYKNIYLPLARSEGVASPQLKAMAAYENEAYEKVVMIFTSIPDSSVVAGDQFYYAVSLLLSGQVEPANEIFTPLTEDVKYGIPAQWYLFLSAIKNDDEEKIKRYGDSLRDQTSHAFISRKVNEILERLN